MAKAQALVSSDLAPVKSHPLGATRQRGVVPSAEFVPMQFRMPRAFVKEFKQTALDHDMKLNELLLFVFNEFKKTAKK